MAAQQGTLVLMAGNKVYTVDLYLPDAVNTKLGFNSTGGAGSTSDTTYRIPENCNIVDISIAAAPTATGAALINNSGVVNGGTVRWANQLCTLATRMKLKIPLKAGDIISFTQF